MRLYTAVLAEISDVQIAERDRQLIREQFQRQLEKQLFVASWALSAQLATADYVNAVKTGANSWWDYRALTWQKDFDTWKVDKAQIVAVVDKSSLFLDTFWKMTRKRGIPDRWLVRGDDLDQLEIACRETDPETRLRVLRRMEPFMECYPPYWYYVGRTQQALGQLFASSNTYEKTVALGDSHFRRDEMLAAALANRAIIQQFLQQPGAPLSARAALDHATSVWEVNLACAAVLERHGYVHEAEDAILRNLDVGLEREQSRVALLSLYARAGERDKLARKLRGAALPPMPPHRLAELAIALRDDPAAASLHRRLAETLSVHADLRFGKDDLVLVASPGWNLAQAELSVDGDVRIDEAPTRTTHRNGTLEARWKNVGELGIPLKPAGLPRSLVVTIEWNDGRRIALRLQPSESDSAGTDNERPLFAFALPAPQRQPVWRIAGVSGDR